MISKNKFCVNPWLQFRINADGSVSYCSRAVDESSQVNSENFLAEFNHNTYITNSRQNFLLESPAILKNCVRCYQEEETGIGKFRELQNLQAFIMSGEHFSESFNQSELPGKIHTTEQFYPRHVFVKFNNHCNLTCKHCLPKSSSALNQLYKKHNYSGYEKKFDIQSGWTENKNMWESFLNITVENPELHTLQINGGEPIFESATYKILKELIAHKKQHVTINIASNVTEYKPELMELLIQFSHVTLDMSVETFSKVNDYIRYPSEYQTIKDNIQQYLSWNSYKNLHFYLHITPQIYSIDELYTVLDFAETQNLMLTCNKIWPQKFLDVSLLPDVHKARLTEFYQSRYQNSSNTSIQSVVNKLVRWLMYELESSENLKKQFVKFTKDHDTMTGTNFLDYFPQYADFYKEYQ